MEPQDNVKLAITKAISAHEAAEASLADLVASADRRFASLAERIRQNLAELHRLAAEEPEPT
jgi:orotate phosphoribosyltransferase